MKYENIHPTWCLNILCYNCHMLKLKLFYVYLLILVIVNCSARTNSQLGSVWLISCHVFVASTDALTNGCFLYLHLGQPFCSWTRLVQMLLWSCGLSSNVSELAILRLSKPINDALKEFVETIELWVLLQRLLHIDTAYL